MQVQRVSTRCPAFPDTPSPFVTILILMPLPRLSAPVRQRLQFLLLVVLSIALMLAWPRQRLDPAPQSAPPAVTGPVGPTSPRSAPASAAEPVVDGATENSAPKPLPSLKPHRASASQRAADLERLTSETDLNGFADELRARADAGDADAAWMLADLLEGCATMAEIATMGAALTQQFDSMRVMGYSDQEIALLQTSLQLWTGRCSTFPARSREAWRAQISSSRTRAAVLGHPGAMLMQPLPRGPADSPAVVQATQRARDAGVTLLQQGDALDLLGYAPQLARLSGYGTDSYLMAACSLLDGCLRDPRAYALTMDQDQFLIGLSNSFLELSELSPRRRLIVEAQSAEILRLWRARQYEQLLGGSGG